MIALEMDATIEKIMLKSKILMAGIKRQRQLIEDFREAIKDIIARETKETDACDTHHQSFKSETMAEVSLLSDQLQLANHELEQLMHIQNYSHEIHPKVEYGTVVKTDKEIFFISVGVEQFLVDDLPIFGLSVQSPIYKVMRGKKVGDSFTYHGITYLIEEIF